RWHVRFLMCLQFWKESVQAAATPGAERDHIEWTRIVLVVHLDRFLGSTYLTGLLAKFAIANGIIDRVVRSITFGVERTPTLGVDSTLFAAQRCFSSLPFVFPHLGIHETALLFLCDGASLADGAASDRLFLDDGEIRTAA